MIEKFPAARAYLLIGPGQLCWREEIEMTGRISLSVLTPLAGVLLIACLPARAAPEPRNYGQIPSGIEGLDKTVRFVKLFVKLT